LTVNGLDRRSVVPCAFFVFELHSIHSVLDMRAASIFGSGAVATRARPIIAMRIGIHVAVCAPFGRLAGRFRFAHASKVIKLPAITALFSHRRALRLVLATQVSTEPTLLAACFAVVVLDRYSLVSVHA
jgi:hypothetical protein